MVKQKSMSGLYEQEMSLFEMLVTNLSLPIFWFQSIFMVKILCTGRFPRPDELIENTIRIEGIRNYSNSLWHKSITCSTKINCISHLDYEYDLEKFIWESKMVSNIS